MSNLSYYLNPAVSTESKVTSLVNLDKKEALKMLAKVLATKMLENMNSSLRSELLIQAPNDVKNEFVEVTGTGVADPYIYPMCSKVPLKLPNLEQTYRLYQNNDTFINVEVSKADKKHKERMIHFVKQLGKDTQNVIDDGFFFSKCFIVDGKHKIFIDLRKKTFSLLEGSNKNFFKLRETYCISGTKDWNGKSQNVIIEWRTKEHIKMKATINFFENPHIENGITVSVNKLPEKAIGLCVKNFRPKLMRLPKLITEHYKKISTRVKKSKSPFQNISIISNNEGWIMKNNSIKLTL